MPHRNRPPAATDEHCANYHPWNYPDNVYIKPDKREAALLPENMALRKYWRCKQCMNDLWKRSHKKSPLSYGKCLSGLHDKPEKGRCKPCAASKADDNRRKRRGEFFETCNDNERALVVLNCVGKHKIYLPQPPMPDEELWCQKCGNWKGVEEWTREPRGTRGEPEEYGVMPQAVVLSVIGKNRTWSIADIVHNMS